MKSYLIILIVSWMLIIGYFIYDSRKPAEEIKFLEGGDIAKAQMVDSLKNLSDSLYAELYPCEIELNRYQIAFQIFMKRNPKAAEEYATIISEETE